MASEFRFIPKLLPLFVAGNIQAATFFVSPSSVCPNNGDGTADSCAASAGAPGRFNSIMNASTAVQTAGDVIRVHTGEYAERFQPLWSGVNWQTFGDGHVTLRATGASLLNSTQFYLPCQVGHAGFVRAVNDVTVDSANLTTSRWKFDGDLLAVNTFNIWRCTGNSGNNIKIQGADWIDGETGGIVEGDYPKFYDVTGSNMSWQGINFQGARGWELRRAKFWGNRRRGGNDDGMIYQDTKIAPNGTGGLIEDVELWDFRDGLDGGSQCSGLACEGPLGVIYRRVYAHDDANNSNGILPMSTLHGAIPGRNNVTMEYVTAVGSEGWGQVVIYESPTGVEIWNSDFINGKFNINISTGDQGTNAKRGGIYNSILRSWTFSFNDAPGTAIQTTGAAGNQLWQAQNICYRGSISGVKNAGNMIGPNCQATFVNQAAGDFNLVNNANNAPLINSGVCMNYTADAATNATTIRVVKNPFNYFWLGNNGSPSDTIRVGADTRTITAMTATTITFNAPVTVARGACVHLPYNGSAPDIGSFETNF